MPKKRNNKPSSSGSKKSLNKIRSGGGAFKDASVPVNTPSRKLNNPGNSK